MINLTIRSATPTDADAIDAIHRSAFGQEIEGKLVRDLEAEGVLVVSLVALVDENLVGHIAFSSAPIVKHDRSSVNSVILGPVGVLPAFQKQGIGGRLIRDGLDACRQIGIEAVFLVGHSTYYPRFGFSAALAQHLQAPWQGDAFMAIELIPGSLSPSGGRVTLPRSFDGL